MEAGGIFLEEGTQNRRIELEERIEAESSKDCVRGMEMGSNSWWV